MPILWGATVTGVLNKIPALKQAQDNGQTVDADPIEDALETACSYMLARVGGAADGSIVPSMLADMARSLAEVGAASMYEAGARPEDENGNSLANTLWKRFTDGLEQLALGIEREGVEPSIGSRPAVNMPPPWLLQWRGF